MEDYIFVCYAVMLQFIELRNSEENTVLFQLQLHLVEMVVLGIADLIKSMGQVLVAVKGQPDIVPILPLLVANQVVHEEIHISLIRELERETTREVSVESGEELQVGVEYP